MKRLIVCVTGASGFIGRSLVEELLYQGYLVRVLTRHSNSIFSLGTEVFVGDLTSRNCHLDKFVAGCQVLLHCAGEIRLVPAMQQVHIGGTQRLLEAVLKESEETGRQIHWVQLSSVGAYGPPQPRANIDRTLTEASPPSPVGEYEITKTYADELVIRASENGSITYAILRPSNVIGVNMTNQSLRSLIQVVKRGLFFYIGKPGAVATYVYVDDVVTALIKCAFDPRAKGKIFNLSSDCLLEELVDHISAVLGVRKTWLRVPEMPIRFAAALLEGRMNIPLTRSRIDSLVSRTRYPATRIVSELNFTFTKPLPIAIDEFVWPSK